MSKFVFVFLMLGISSAAFGNPFGMDFESYESAIKNLKERGVVLEESEQWLFGEENHEDFSIIWLLNGDNNSPAYKSFAKIVIFQDENGAVDTKYAVHCNNKVVCKQFTGEIAEMAESVAK